jgi:hypothetical protein
MSCEFKIFANAKPFSTALVYEPGGQMQMTGKKRDKKSHATVLLRKCLE